MGDKNLQWSVSEDRILTLGTRSCSGCWGKGTVATEQPCKTCKGTAKGPRGGRGKCRDCFHGHVWDQNIRETCGKCKGSLVEPASRYDYTPDNFLRNYFEVKVIRSGRKPLWVESWLGVGLYSTTDYGRYKSQNDDELAEDVIKHNTQFCNVVDKEMRLAKHILILCHDQGYSVLAEFVGNTVPAFAT
jgi:RecJ-like exonuclease